MNPRQAEHPRPNHFLLHISDTHLIDADAGLYGSAVDSADTLRRLIADVDRSEARPDAVVITGDVADKGEAGAYVKVRELLEPAAARWGAEIVWVMGNHDERGAFREHLLGQFASDRPVDRVHDLHGLRLIVLDTTVPGHHHGEVTDAQLDWLAEELATAAPHGTILALHHPPVPAVQDLAVLVELRDQHKLAEVLEGSDVRSILGGHLHYSSTATFAGIPVSVASATCYTQDLAEAGRGTRGRDGAQSYNLVHVYERTVLHTVVPMGDFATVGRPADAAETARRLEAAGVVIADAPDLPVPVEEPLTVPIPMLRADRTA